MLFFYSVWQCNKNFPFFYWAWQCNKNTYFFYPAWQRNKNIHFFYSAWQCNKNIHFFYSAWHQELTLVYIFVHTHNNLSNDSIKTFRRVLNSLPRNQSFQFGATLGWLSDSDSNLQLILYHRAESLHTR